MDLKGKEFSLSDPFLFQRAIRGGFWVFVLRITYQFFRLIRLIILARILAPRDFGLIGIALLTMAVLETFSQTGFQFALIQKKKEISEYLILPVDFIDFLLFNIIRFPFFLIPELVLL